MSIYPPLLFGVPGRLFFFIRVVSVPKKISGCKWVKPTNQVNLRQLLHRLSAYHRQSNQSSRQSTKQSVNQPSSHSKTYQSDIYCITFGVTNVQARYDKRLSADNVVCLVSSVYDERHLEVLATQLTKANSHASALHGIHLGTLKT